jgi:hypothetical protein
MTRFVGPGRSECNHSAAAPGSKRKRAACARRELKRGYFLRLVCQSHDVTGRVASTVQGGAVPLDEARSAGFRSDHVNICCRLTWSILAIRITPQSSGQLVLEMGAAIVSGWLFFGQCDKLGIRELMRAGCASFRCQRQTLAQVGNSNKAGSLSPFDGAGQLAGGGERDAERRAFGAMVELSPLAARRYLWIFAYRDGRAVSNFTRNGWHHLAAKLIDPGWQGSWTLPATRPQPSLVLPALRR